MATAAGFGSYDTLLFLKLYFTAKFVHISLFSTFTFVFFEHFRNRYDWTLHYPSHRPRKMFLLNLLASEEHVFKTETNVLQSFFHVTDV